MRRKRKPVNWKGPLSLLAILVILPLAGRVLWAGAAMLGRAGESAAMLSAALMLPDGSAPLLKERFQAEIYNPEGEHGFGQDIQGEPLPQQPSAVPEAEQEDPLEPEINRPSVVAPRIPDQYAAPIIAEDFSGKEGGTVLRYENGLIRNETSFDEEDVLDILETQWPVKFENIQEPQVLIFHTHATEAFEKYDSDQYDVRNTWRSTDNSSNMVAVGDAMTQVLEQRGISVLHDTTQHDYPSYNGSYERSAETIQAYLDAYPSIKVVLDLHRDAMQRGDAIVKPVAVVEGKQAAQIMIISACDDGTMEIPQWRENLRFASLFQNYMEQTAPGLTRPVYLCYRKYNMDLTTGSLLLEFGSNANTLEEAVYSATLAGEALADLIQANTWDSLDGEEEDTQEE